MSPNPQETAGLIIFTEEILNGRLPFCAVFQNNDFKKTNLHVKVKSRPKVMLVFVFYL